MKALSYDVYVQLRFNNVSADKIIDSFNKGEPINTCLTASDFVGLDTVFPVCVQGRYTFFPRGSKGIVAPDGKRYRTALSFCNALGLNRGDFIREMYRGKSLASCISAGISDNGCF